MIWTMTFIYAHLSFPKTNHFFILTQLYTTIPLNYSIQTVRFLKNCIIICSKILKPLDLPFTKTNKNISQSVQTECFLNHFNRILSSFKNCCCLYFLPHISQTIRLTSSENWHSMSYLIYTAYLAINTNRMFFKSLKCISTLTKIIDEKLYPDLHTHTHIKFF